MLRPDRFVKSLEWARAMLADPKQVHTWAAGISKDEIEYLEREFSRRPSRRPV